MKTWVHILVCLALSGFVRAYGEDAVSSASDSAASGEAATGEVAPQSGATEESIPQAAPEPPTPAPPTPSPLATVFSVEENPGKGTLTFTRGEAARVIQFGKAHGHYALGLVFDTKKLPNPYRSEYGRNLVIQLVFGKIPSKREGQVPQFGSVALLGRFIPKRIATFPLGKQKSPANRKSHERKSLMMIMDPETAEAQTDEQRLRNTFFGVAGNLIVQPKSKTRSVNLSAEGESIQFSSKVLSVKIDCAVSTPFNPIDSRVEGSVEVPIYWPKGAQAESLVAGIARELFTGPDVRFALPQPKRSLTQKPLSPAKSRQEK